MAERRRSGGSRTGGGGGVLPAPAGALSLLYSALWSGWAAAAAQQAPDSTGRPVSSSKPLSVAAPAAGANRSRT